MRGFGRLAAVAAAALLRWLAWAPLGLGRALDRAADKLEGWAR